MGEATRKGSQIRHRAGPVPNNGALTIITITKG